MLMSLWTKILCWISVWKYWQFNASVIDCIVYISVFHRYGILFLFQGEKSKESEVLVTLNYTKTKKEFVNSKQGLLMRMACTKNTLIFQSENWAIFISCRISKSIKEVVGVCNIWGIPKKVAFFNGIIQSST